jgi:pyruvate dehydrogenase E2 component (dihydrolipoamide acetyltransferase)
MATKVHMEALSPTMEEGQLVRWLKHEGDAVGEGDVLAEIETDKATMELVARGAGVLRGVKLQEGETAPVGTVIAVIAGEGEDVGGDEAEAGEEPGRAQSQEASAAGGGRAGAVAEEAGEEVVEEAEGAEVVEGKKADTEEAGDAAAGERAARPAAAAGGGGERAERQSGPAKVEVEEEELTGSSRARASEGATRPDGRVRASPLARRLALEAGVELTSVRGTGPGGRITKGDIEAALARPAEREAPVERAEPAASPAPAAERGPAEAAGEVEEVPVSQMRKTIAKRLITSIGPVPTFYLTVEVDVSRTLEVRERLNARLEKDGTKASINDFILKAVAMALSRHPEVNASWGDTVIRRHHRVHVGVAVAIEDGLITPVVRDADRKGVGEIAREVRELAGRAREKKLKPDEYTGATFSVSNLGMFGIHEFTAIINPPEAGILAVGAVEDTVVAKDGQPIVRPMMRMTMSCDHRVVDGATGARFLQTLHEYMEDPMMMLA